MPKDFTPEFNKRIRQVAKSFNAKVDRQQEKTPSANLPSKVTIKGLKDAYPSQRALESKLKLLERYNTDKMNQIIKIGREQVGVPRYEYESFLLNKKVAKKKIQKLLEKNIAKDKSEGRFLPSQRTRSLKAQLHTLESTDGKTIKNFNKYLASSRVAGRYSDKREQTDRQFYENFFDMLWADQLYAELDPDMVQEIHDMIEQLTPEQLLEMYNSEPDISRLVEDYHLYTDSEGFLITDEEVIRARIRLENLHDILPALIEKYKKM